jgi:CrcB protein
LIAYITLGGIAGTLARWYLDGFIQDRTGGVFPSGTLVINLAGSFLIGFIIRYATGTTTISPELRGGLTIGFCGAFTTMSTFSYETVRLLADGDYARASLYAGGTMVGCVLAVVIGAAVAGRLL